MKKARWFYQKNPNFKSIIYLPKLKTSVEIKKIADAGFLKTVAAFPSSLVHYLTVIPPLQSRRSQQVSIVRSQPQSSPRTTGDASAEGGCLWAELGGWGSSLCWRPLQSSQQATNSATTTAWTYTTVAAMPVSSPTTCHAFMVSFSLFYYTGRRPPGYYTLFARNWLPFCVDCGVDSFIVDGCGFHSDNAFLSITSVFESLEMRYWRF